MYLLDRLSATLNASAVTSVGPASPQTSVASGSAQHPEFWKYSCRSPHVPEWFTPTELP